MKRIFFGLIVMFGLLTQAQSITVKYNKKIVNPDRAESNFETNWVLKVKDGRSLYEPIDEIRDETEMKEFMVEGEIQTAPSTRYINYDIYYMDIGNKEKITLHHFVGKDYLVKESLELMEWEIKNETKKIDIYNCRLAVVDKNGYLLKVWFTDEIPVSIGPDGNNGLPGLILEYHLGFSHLFVKEISFDKEITVIPPDSGKKVTKEQFDGILTGTYRVPEEETTTETNGGATTTTTKFSEVKEFKAKKGQ